MKIYLSFDKNNVTLLIFCRHSLEMVILRIDRGFTGGVDFLIAAAMGAREQGFGSMAMVAT